MGNKMIINVVIVDDYLRLHWKISLSISCHHPIPPITHLKVVTLLSSSSSMPTLTYINNMLGPYPSRFLAKRIIFIILFAILFFFLFFSFLV